MVVGGDGGGTHLWCSIGVVVSASAAAVVVRWRGERGGRRRRRRQAAEAWSLAWLNQLTRVVPDCGETAANWLVLFGLAGLARQIERPTPHQASSLRLTPVSPPQLPPAQGSLSWQGYVCRNPMQVQSAFEAACCSLEAVVSSLSRAKQGNQANLDRVCAARPFPFPCHNPWLSRSGTRYLPTMRSLLSLCVFVLAGVVSALSTSGNRLLVVLDDVADKEGYSQFLGDLEGPSCTSFTFPIHPR